MVQALLLLPRLVVTPPARLAVAPPHCAAVRRFTAPGVQLGEDGGRPARGAEQLRTATAAGAEDLKLWKQTTAQAEARCREVTAQLATSQSEGAESLQV